MARNARTAGTASVRLMIILSETAAGPRPATRAHKFIKQLSAVHVVGFLESDADCYVTRSRGHAASVTYAGIVRESAFESHAVQRETVGLLFDGRRRGDTSSRVCQIGTPVPFVLVRD